MNNQTACRIGRRKGAGDLLALTAITALIASCGGGGSGAPPAPPAPPPAANQAPSFTSANAVAYVENGTGTVYQATASDPEGSALTFAITGGADAALFTVSASGQLRFNASPNFDLAADADGNNVYQVQLTVSDGQASGTLSLAITVTNSKEGIAVRRVGTGFANPVAVAAIGETAVLVAEKNGAIYRLDPQTGTRVLLIQIANVGTVLAMTADRDYATTGTFYVMYTSTTGFVLVNRFLRNPAGPIVPDNFGPLLAVPAAQYAGGGWLGLDGQGELLIATGDGSASEGASSSQDDGIRLGKVLRVTRNPDPFAGASPNFFLISTIAKGLHRPNGGTLYANGLLIGDSGRDFLEEVDYLAPASGIGNFGWPFKEGTRIVGGAPPANVIDPVLEYAKSSGSRVGQGVVGGVVAGGASTIASLRDQYVFADRGGAIFSVPASSLQTGRTLASGALERRDADFVPDVGAIDRPVAVTAGSTGIIYIVDDDGDIFRVDAG